MYAGNRSLQSAQMCGYIRWSSGTALRYERVITKHGVSPRDPRGSRPADRHYAVAACVRLSVNESVDSAGCCRCRPPAPPTHGMCGWIGRCARCTRTACFTIYCGDAAGRTQVGQAQPPAFFYLEYGINLTLINCPHSRPKKYSRKQRIHLRRRHIHCH